MSEHPNGTVGFEGAHAVRAEAISQYDKYQDEIDALEAEGLSQAEKDQRLNALFIELEQLYREIAKESYDPLVLQKDAGSLLKYLQAHRHNVENIKHRASAGLDPAVIAQRIGAYAEGLEGGIQTYKSKSTRRFARALAMAPGVDTTLHMFKVEPRVITRAARAERVQGPAEEALNLQANELDDDGEAREIKKIYDVILSLWRQSAEPVPLYELIYHPTSFAQTVENLFYTSFLVKDGKIRLLMKNGEIPYIMPSEQPMPEEEEGFGSLEDIQTENGSHNQLVMEMSYDLWKGLGEVSYPPYSWQRRPNDTFKVGGVPDEPALPDQHR